MVQEKEKLYVELKGILVRQPGPEVSEQLSIYQVRRGTQTLHAAAHPAAALTLSLPLPAVPALPQASLRDKTKQLKALASELNMYRAQVCLGCRPGACVHHHIRMAMA